MDLKQRIFGEQNLLEEILNSIVEEPFFLFPLEEAAKIEQPAPEAEIQVEDKERIHKILLYESEPGSYEVYVRKDEDEEKETYRVEESHGLFVPAGVTVRRVPQHILGYGVLGRAFMGQNYIEILDRLIGNEYTEVLTHEVLHILHPEKKEMEIRNMTRNYLGANNTVYH